MKSAFTISLALLATVGILSFAALTTAQPTAHTETFSMQTQDDQLRSYNVFHPSKISHAKAGVPLILVLHGNGEHALLSQAESGFDAVAEENGFFVAYPNGTPKYSTHPRMLSWNTDDDLPLGDDVAFLDEVIDEIKKNYPIDSDRIFVAGMSNGAAMAHRYVCEGVHAIAGILSVSGNGNHWSDCALQKPVPTVSVLERNDALYNEDFDNLKFADLIVDGETVCTQPPEVTIDRVSDTVTTYIFKEDCLLDIERIHYRIDGGVHGWHHVRFFDRTKPNSPDYLIVSKTDAQLAWSVFARY